MIRYLVNRAHPYDGGWGLHTEGECNRFWDGDELSRLEALWMSPPEHSVATKARKRLHELGGGAVLPALGENVVELFELVDRKSTRLNSSHVD